MRTPEPRFGWNFGYGWEAVSNQSSGYARLSLGHAIASFAGGPYGLMVLGTLLLLEKKGQELQYE